jgi:hypothetical protein
MYLGELLRGIQLGLKVVHPPEKSRIKDEKNNE